MGMPEIVEGQFRAMRKEESWLHLSKRSARSLQGDETVRLTAPSSKKLAKLLQRL
jgi:hypothetical protein